MSSTLPIASLANSPYPLWSYMCVRGEKENFAQTAPWRLPTPFVDCKGHVLGVSDTGTTHILHPHCACLYCVKCPHCYNRAKAAYEMISLHWYCIVLNCYTGTPLSPVDYFPGSPVKVEQQTYTTHNTVKPVSKSVSQSVSSVDGRGVPLFHNAPGGEPPAIPFLLIISRHLSFQATCTHPWWRYIPVYERSFRDDTKIRLSCSNYVDLGSNYVDLGSKLCRLT